MSKSRKRKLSVFVCLILMLLQCIALPFHPVNVQAAAPFAKGADVGWLSQLESNGVKWYDDSGAQKDALQILKDHGIDSIRLRVFVNPSSTYKWTKPDGTTCLLGYSDKANVVSMAQRAKKMGFRIMIDFHYSDVFADPAYQIKPAAWSNYAFAQLKTAVYNHTYDVMSALKNVGVYPEWVQVGNEINPGLLLPEGSTNNYSQMTQLLNSGYDAVKAVSSSSKVITHLANGYNNSLFRTFFDNFITANGGKTDVIGLSYYPYWNNVDYTQNINALGSNLNDMASRYGKEVMLCEVGGLENNTLNSYDLLLAVQNKVKAVPNGKGIGVFYWEPECNQSVVPDSYPLGATAKIGANQLQFTGALDAFRSNARNNPVLNPSFESGLTNWSTYTPQSGSIYSENGGHTGSKRLTFWKNVAYEGKAWQNITGLANGTYTLSAWVQNTGTFSSCTMTAKDYKSGITYTKNISNTSGWTHIVLTNINVTNGQIEVGFFGKASANGWLAVDDVLLTRN